VSETIPKRVSEEIFEKMEEAKDCSKIA